MGCREDGVGKHGNDSPVQAHGEHTRSNNVHHSKSMSSHVSVILFGNRVFADGIRSS